MKRRVGEYKDKVLIEGDANNLNEFEILITEDEGYTILRKRIGNDIKSYVIVPLKEFKRDATDTEKKV